MRRLSSWVELVELRRSTGCSGPGGGPTCSSEKLARFLRMKFAGCAYHRVLRHGVERERGPLAVGALGGAGERVLRRVGADDVTIVAVADGDCENMVMARSPAAKPSVHFCHLSTHFGVPAGPFHCSFGSADATARSARSRGPAFVSTSYRCPNRSPAAARREDKIEMGRAKTHVCNASGGRRSAEDAASPVASFIKEPADRLATRHRRDSNILSTHARR